MDIDCRLLKPGWIALGSGGESSQPRFCQLGCTKPDLEKMANAGVAAHVSEHLRMLHLLIAGHKSRHRALQDCIHVVPAVNLASERQHHRAVVASLW